MIDDGGCSMQPKQWCLIEGGLYFLWWYTGAAITGGTETADWGYFGWHIHGETHDLLWWDILPCVYWWFCGLSMASLARMYCLCKSQLNFFINSWWMVGFSFLNVCFHQCSCISRRVKIPCCQPICLVLANFTLCIGIRPDGREEINKKKQGKEKQQRRDWRSNWIF